MDFGRLSFQDWSLKNFDRDLQKFYNKVLQKELNLFHGATAGSVKQALKEVVHAYKKETVEAFQSNILFDSPEKRCAYVLKHCPCFSSAVARHFHLLLKQNPFILYNAVNLHRQVNVCCLGGGPATDVVALVKVINTLNNSIRTVTKEKLRLNVTIVDLNKGWEMTARRVIETLQTTPEFCHSEKMAVSFDFLKADLTEEWEHSVKYVLSKADIATMVYFVSAVNGTRAIEKCPRMLQNIMGTLKTGALLFFLDSAKDLHYENVKLAAKLIKNVNLIYGPRLQEFHTLSIKSIRKFLELYPKRFNMTMCLTDCFVSSAGWVKSFLCCEYCFGDGKFCRDWWDYPAVDLGDEEVSVNDIKVAGHNSRNKMKTYNTKKQERFRQKIEGIFGSGVNTIFADDDIDNLEDDYDRETVDWGCDVKILNAAKSKAKRIVPWSEG